MGQYWKCVNLDKREFLHPYNLACGLKLYEQLANHGVGQALVILLTAMPEPRGGGDFKPDPIIGRWAGDRVVFVGDYAEDEDFPTKPDELPFSQVYEQCGDPPREFTDISEQVARVIERELGGRFVGSGWKDWREE